MSAVLRFWRVASELTLGIALLAFLSGGCSRVSSPPPESPEEIGATADEAASRNPTPPAPAQERHAHDRQPAPPSSVAAQVNDWWQRPLPDVFDALQEAAAAGDMRAAHLLGRRSAECRTTLRRHTPESILSEHRSLRDAISLDLGTAVPDEPSRDERSEQELQAKLSHYEDCAVIGEERISKAAAWLEHAGRSGMTPAQLDFVAHALREYEAGRAALIADIEEASRRRKIAREWLEQLVRNGDEQALNHYVDALQGDNGLYARDELAFMVHAYALDLVRGRRVGRFDRLWQEGPERYDRFTTAEWDEIASRGREIYRKHFEHTPVWPNR